MINLIVKYVMEFSQLLAIIVIIIGMLKSFFIFMKDLFSKQLSKEAIKESRLELGHSFSLGLGFLIGSSILKTVTVKDPTWNDIGMLTAIIAIRTILNFFLTREIKEDAKKEVNNGGN